MIAAALSVGGCYGESGPGPTPGAMDDVIANIVLQDTAVLHLTSGDAGCPSSSLHDNAVHLTLVIGAQSASHEVYLLRWKNQREFDEAQAEFDRCFTEYSESHHAPVGAVRVAPWRAYGPFWTAQLETIVVTALRATGGATPAP